MIVEVHGTGFWTRVRLPRRSTQAEHVESLYVLLSYTGIRFVWCIEENKSNGIVCCESDIQCRYFLCYTVGYELNKSVFIGVDDIKNTYLPMGFSNFKIEGRGLGSVMILEFLLYYMTKPPYQIHVREHIYLDNMLDLF